MDLPTDADGYAALLADLEAIAGSASPDPLDYTDAEGVFDQAAYDAAVSQWSSDVDTATQALTQYDEVLAAAADLQAAQDEFDTATDAVSEEALIQAIVDGLNATGAGPIDADDVTPEMLDWVSQQMGVGDADGLIDDYLKSLVEEDQASAEDFIGPVLPGEDELADES